MIITLHWWLIPLLLCVVALWFFWRSNTAWKRDNTTGYVEAGMGWGLVLFAGFMWLGHSL